MQWSAFAMGATAAVAARAALVPALRVKFRRDIRRLNAGDHRPMLAAYAPDAVLRFAPGDHRFAGVWTGRAAIEVFLQRFTDAGLQGEIREIATSGPPWAMRLWARFDDRSVASDGTVLYENRAVLVLRTRWGRIVEQDDFLADTAPVEHLERALQERGVQPVGHP